MKSQDKLFEDFKSAAQADEERSFSAPDQLWARIEKQLDIIETKPKRIAYRNVMYVAAGIIAFLGLGLAWFFASNDNVNTTPPSIVVQDKNESNSAQTHAIESENIAAETVVKEASSQAKTQVHKQLDIKPTNTNEPQIVVAQLATLDSRPNPDLQLVAEKASENNTSAAIQIPVEVIEMRTVSGIVMDKNGPIAGASVTIKGSDEKLQVDEKGNFTINIPVNKSELIVSSFGLETQTISLNEKESYMVLMEPDYKGAEVFGAIVNGTKYDKRNQTKSLNSVAPQGISSKTANSITEILERATPGILPSKNGTFSSLASENALIRQSPIYSNDPLIVVNGAPFDGKFSEINAKDIEKIDILNEAAGRAVFGSRAKNGVIQVTLKQGKSIDDFKQIKSSKSRKK